MNVTMVLTALAPEHLLLAGIVGLVILEVAAGKPRAAMALSLAAVVAACAAAIGLAASGYAAEPFPGQVSVDPGSLLSKAVVLALAVPVLLISRGDFGDRQFHILVLSALYGACLMLGADSFLTLFLGIEMLSLPVYVLVMLAFRRPEAAEAALKYLVLGGAASATLLMGASLVYGWSGSLGIEAFTRAIGSGEPMAVAGAALVLMAFFLKAAVVPFHAWAPDAYEAAAVPVTAFMAAVVKAGVLLAAVRLFAGEALGRSLVEVVAILPLASIVWGNLAAMRQASLRRMIAYSSIAHAGYLFYAFLGDGALRLQAVAFYLLAYGVMNVLAFAMLPREGDDAARDRLDTLQGLFHRKPYAALAIAVAMLSLSGLPPFPGFIGKFLIFKNVIDAGYTFYAVLGLVASYLGIYFYLRVVQLMFMNERSIAAPVATQAGARLEARDGLALAAGTICLAAGVVMAVLPGWVLARL